MMCKYFDLMFEILPEISNIRASSPSSEPTAFWFKTL